MSFLTTTAANVTSPNTTADIINQQIYADRLLAEFDAWLVGRPLFANVTDEFAEGDDYQLVTTADRTLASYTEDAAISFSGMDTSTSHFSITEYPLDAFYITDKLKQDSRKAMKFWDTNVRKSIEAFKVKLETDVLAKCNSVQTAADANAIEGVAHRISGSGDANGKIAVADFSRMKLAFDVAKVPVENRVAVISPYAESQLNQLLNITEVTNGDLFNNDIDGLVNVGFGDKLNVVRNIFGWNIVISHHLAQITSETVDGVAHTDASACVFMSMASEDTMPIMGAIRQEPAPEFFRNTSYKRDEWSATARWGFGLQRPESLGILIVQNA
jgi:hypothetical protein